MKEAAHPGSSGIAAASKVAGVRGAPPELVWYWPDVDRWARNAGRVLSIAANGPD
jgi:hypothetical protein